MSQNENPPHLTTPFTTEQASRAGVAKRELRGTAFRTVVRGVHAGSREPMTTRLRAQAVLLATPTAIFARHTAAELWGGVVPTSPDIHIAVGRRHGSTRLGVRASRHDHLPEHREVNGLLLTSPERTFLDLASQLELVDLVVLGDSLVRKGVTDPTSLIAAARGHHGRDVRRARQAAALVRSEVDSPMETRLRLLITLAGLPEPRINHLIFDESGSCVFRLDLAFPDIRLAIEYDGRQHAESTRQWTSDVARREQLESLGWRLVVVLSRDIYAEPGPFLRRLCEIMTSRGMGVGVTDSAWKRHFPGRRAA